MLDLPQVRQSFIADISGWTGPISSLGGILNKVEGDVAKFSRNVSNSLDMKGLRLEKLSERLKDISTNLMTIGRGGFVGIGKGVVDDASVEKIRSTTKAILDLKMVLSSPLRADFFNQLKGAQFSAAVSGVEATVTRIAGKLADTRRQVLQQAFPNLNVEQRLQPKTEQERVADDEAMANRLRFLATQSKAAETAQALLRSTAAKFAPVTIGAPQEFIPGVTQRMTKISSTYFQPIISTIDKETSRTNTAWDRYHAMMAKNMTKDMSKIGRPVLANAEASRRMIEGMTRAGSIDPRRPVWEKAFGEFKDREFAIERAARDMRAPRTIAEDRLSPNYAARRANVLGSLEAQRQQEERLDARNALAVSQRVRSLSQGGGGIGGRIRGLISDFSESSFGRFAGPFMAYHQFQTGIRNMTEGWVTFIREMTQAATTLTQGLVSATGGLVAGVIEGFQTVAKGFFNGLEQAVRGLLYGDLIGGAVRGLGTSLTQGVSAFGKTISSTISSVTGGISSLISGTAGASAAQLRGTGEMAGAGISLGGTLAAGGLAATGFGAPVAIATLAITNAAGAITSTIGRVMGEFEAMAGQVASTIVSSIGGAVVQMVGKITETLVIGLGEVTGVVAEIAGGLTKKAMEFDKLETIFGTLVGNAERGKQLFGEIQSLSIITPYTRDALTDAGEQLLSMGIPADNLVATLARLGDVATGSASEIRKMAMYLGEVAEGGKLTQFRLREFAKLGVTAQDVSKTMGVGLGEFHIMLGKNLVPGTVMIDTINRLTQAGGRFFQSNEKLMETSFGQWTRLGNIIDRIASKMSRAFTGGAGLTEGLSSFGDLLEINSDRFVKFAKNAGEFLGDLIKGFADLGERLLARIDLSGFQMPTPEGVVSFVEGVIEGLISSFKKLIAIVEMVGEVFKKLLGFGLTMGAGVLERFATPGTFTDSPLRNMLEAVLPQADADEWTAKLTPLAFELSAGFRNFGQALLNGQPVIDLIGTTAVNFNQNMQQLSTALSAPTPSQGISSWNPFTTAFWTPPANGVISSMLNQSQGQQAQQQPQSEPWWDFFLPPRTGVIRPFVENLFGGRQQQQQPQQTQPLFPAEWQAPLQKGVLTTSDWLLRRLPNVFKEMELAAKRHTEAQIVAAASMRRVASTITVSQTPLEKFQFRMNELGEILNIRKENLEKDTGGVGLRLLQGIRGIMSGDKTQMGEGFGGAVAKGAGVGVDFIKLLSDRKLSERARFESFLGLEKDMGLTEGPKLSEAMTMGSKEALQTIFKASEMRQEDMTTRIVNAIQRGIDNESRQMKEQAEFSKVVGEALQIAVKNQKDIPENIKKALAEVGVVIRGVGLNGP